MKRSISTRYACKSLGRYKRRTALSILGIGLGCGVCIFMIAFVRGEGKMMLKAAAECGNGHFRIAPKAWPDVRDNDLRLTQWQGLVKELRQNKDMRVVTPHTRKEALLAFGTRSVGVQVVGVDPAFEQQTNRPVRKVVQGRYLSGQGEETGVVVIGKTLATRLDVELDDELMITVASDQGDMQRGMLRIVGLVSTGSADLDATVCHVHLRDLEQWTGLPGVGDITVLLEHPRDMDRIIEALRPELPDEATLVTWREIVPELASAAEIDMTWTRLTVGIVMLVVFLGIASAQLTAVLERRREFAVLSALGMRARGLIHVMVVEGLVLGVLGGLLGLALGGGGAYWMAVKGIDFGKMYDNADFSMSNVLIDPIFYSDFGWWLIPLAFELALSATLLSSIYPAWYAARTDPAAALRVEH